MKKKKILAIAIGGIMSVSVVLPGISMIHKMNVNSGFTVNANESEEINFEYVKKHSKEQSFYNSNKGGKFKIYVSTLHVDPLNKVKEVAIYGKLEIPLMSQDIGVSEFDGKLGLGDENFIKYNGAIKSFLIWAPEDKNGKYDKQIFKHDGNIFVRGDSITLTLGGEEYTLKVPDKPMTIDGSFLENAVTEHWGNYMAAVNAGLEIKKDTKDAYLKKNDEARSLLEKINKGDVDITQEQVEKMRKELNEAFGNMIPEPFDRSGIEKQLKIADEMLDKNGKNGKRYTKETYYSLLDAYSVGKDLISREDLKGIVTSKEGEPIKTHRDFRKAEQDLIDKIKNLKMESYAQTDVSDLEEAYYNAVEKMPKEGFGYVEPSRTEFYDKLDKIDKMLKIDKIYADRAEIDRAKEELEKAVGDLQEVKLDMSAKFNVHVKYMHKMKDAVSPLIKEYFKDENGKDIESTFEAVQGQEVRIPLNSPIIKKFKGYHPSTFHYESDDTTLKLVRVIKTKDGKQHVVFRANAKNMTAGASLGIFYEDGEIAPPAQNDPLKPNARTAEDDNYKIAKNIKTGDLSKKKDEKGDVAKLPETGDNDDVMAACGALMLAGFGVVVAIRRKPKE